jgi:hypothetical protein
MADNMTIAPINLLASLLIYYPYQSLLWQIAYAITMP